MNVCLVTARQAGSSELKTKVRETAAAGYRTVVLFLTPQRRRLWVEAGVLYCAPGSGVFAEPLEAAVKRRLEHLRSAWLPRLRANTGAAGRSALRAEHLAFRGLIFGGTRLAGALEAGMSAVLRAGQGDPFAALPGGAANYGAMVSLQPAADAPCRAAAARAEAVFLDAATPDVRGALEQAVLHWLRS